jgi:hypothetical protein
MPHACGKVIQTCGSRFLAIASRKLANACSGFGRAAPRRITRRGLKPASGRCLLLPTRVGGLSESDQRTGNGGFQGVEYLWPPRIVRNGDRQVIDFRGTGMAKKSKTKKLKSKKSKTRKLKSKPQLKKKTKAKPKTKPKTTVPVSPQPSASTAPFATKSETTVPVPPQPSDVPKP